VRSENALSAKADDESGVWRGLMYRGCHNSGRDSKARRETASIGAKIGAGEQRLQPSALSSNEAPRLKRIPLGRQVAYVMVAEDVSASPTRLMMTQPHELRTGRLLLRRWLPADRSAFAALNADSRVMEHFPAVLTPEESGVLAVIERHFEQHGFGLWAVEIPGVASFAGFVGLAVPRFEAHFTPCVEVGWRLAADHWGCGYATEGALAALAFGFEKVGLSEIVSFTVPENQRSRRVMDRIGMAHNPADDFDHPGLPGPRRRHVLYRISRGAAQQRLQPSAAGAA
jgi:RimJ/RimL family protein N-acetyltransferase